MKRKVGLLRGLAALLVALFIIAEFGGALANTYAGAINNFLGLTASSALAEGTGPIYYASSYGELSAESLQKLLEAEGEYCTEQMEESSVLLMNNNGALPLNAEAEGNITLFGRASADIVYRSSNGGPALDPSREVTVLGAFENAGFHVNRALYDAYQQSGTKRVKAGDATEDVGEESPAFYTNELKSSFGSYNDVAIVILSRYGGEGCDVSRNNIDGVPTLALQPDEKSLLELVQASGFKKTIVLINSVYAMDLGELENYGVDACLWIGNPGYYGFNGVVNVLTGKVNPSGHLVDTYATNSLSAPAMQNFGDYTYQGDFSLMAMQNKYVVYSEGIYVGYKYYETRYEDCVMGTGNASGASGVYASADGQWNYADEVVYPFGYGLSYTQFAQTLDSCVYDEATDTFTATVTVKNVGAVAGKDVIQLYVQSPYTDYDRENGVEKAAIQLIAYEKTDVLAPAGEAGDSQTLTLTFDRYLMASYDRNGANGYILEGGPDVNYYFAVGHDAHDALNNILAEKGYGSLYDAAGNAVEGSAGTVSTYNIPEAVDARSYKTSPYTGNEVTNQFGYADINTYYNEDVTVYLSRSDWEYTYPKSIYLTMCEALYNAVNFAKYEKPAGGPSLSDCTYGVDSGLTLADFAQADFDDERWDAFVQQLSITDLAALMTEYFGTPAIESIKKPAGSTGDGPDGSSGAYAYGDNGKCTGYASPVNVASTWDKECQRKFGDFMGEDCLYAKMNTICAPGANIHRTPYSGRNGEYYSEDAILSYYVADICVEAMQNKGLLCTLKHFVLNDQETNRQGVASYCNEQAIREIYCRAFEGALAKGDALCVMTAYSRVGPIFSAADPVLQKTILHDEWGFKGFTMTDNMSENEYSVTADMLANGTNCFGGTSRETSVARLISRNDDGTLLLAAQEGAKRVLYADAHCMLVNGLTRTADIAGDTVWWQYALYGVQIGLGVAAVALVVLYLFQCYRPGGKKRRGA